MKTTGTQMAVIWSHLHKISRKEKLWRQKKTSVFPKAKDGNRNWLWSQKRYMAMAAHSYRFTKNYGTVHW